MAKFRSTARFARAAPEAARRIANAGAFVAALGTDGALCARARGGEWTIRAEKLQPRLNAARRALLRRRAFTPRLHHGGARGALCNQTLKAARAWNWRSDSFE